MSTNRRRHGSGLRSERGAIAVEFALVVPLLLVFLFSIVSVSRAFQVQGTLSAAAREAARTMGIQSDVDAARAAAVFAASTSSISLPPGEVEITPDTCRLQPPRTNVTVTIRHEFQPAGSFVGGVAFTITSKAVFRCGG
jgi:Flp pilus assembly protein TadG